MANMVPPNEVIDYLSSCVDPELCDALHGVVSGHKVDAILASLCVILGSVNAAGAKDEAEACRNSTTLGTFVHHCTHKTYRLVEEQNAEGQEGGEGGGGEPASGSDNCSIH